MIPALYARVTRNWAFQEECIRYARGVGTTRTIAVSALKAAGVLSMLAALREADLLLAPPATMDPQEVEDRRAALLARIGALLNDGGQP